MDVPETHRVCHILGLGAPPADGHVRVSSGPDFALTGGDERAHAAMLDLCLEIQRELQHSGRNLEDLTPHDFTVLLRRIRRRGRRA